MDRKINFTIAGYGHIGRRHAAIIRQMPAAKLVAVVDPVRPPDLEEAWYPDLEAFLEMDTETDVVIIATPNGCHTAHALQCLEARKHIVVEKPLALSKADAEKVIFKALHVHKHVFVVMQNRYAGPMQWIKQLLEAGDLGRISMVQLNCFWNRDARYYQPGSWRGKKSMDGGTLFTQFSHFIDMLYWLFGDIQNIKARFFNHNNRHLTEFEDCGLVSFELTNGGIGALSFSTAVWDKNMESSMTVIAEQGTVKIAGQYMDKVEYCHIRDYQPPPHVLLNEWPGDKSSPNHQLVLENVIGVLHGTDSVATNALEGLKVVEMIEKIYASNTIVKPEMLVYEDYK